MQELYEQMLEQNRSLKLEETCVAHLAYGADGHEYIKGRMEGVYMQKGGSGL